MDGAVVESRLLHWTLKSSVLMKPPDKYIINGIPGNIFTSVHSENSIPTKICLKLEEESRLLKCYHTCIN